MKYAVLLTFALLVSPVAVLAVGATHVTLGAGETVNGNFIRIGTTITLDGHITGDVYVLAQSLTVTGSVDGDVIAAAQNIRITGTVSGSVRTASNLFDLDGVVEKNVTAAAATATFSPKSAVGLASYVAGSSVFFGGAVEGETVVTGESVEMHGTMGDMVTVYSGDEGSVLLGASASLKKDLTVHGQLAPIVTTGATLGGTVNHQIPADPLAGRPWAVQWVSFTRLIMFFGFLFAGLLFVVFLPKPISHSVENMIGRPLASFGVGIATIVLLPIFCIIAFMTIIGIPVALILGAMLGVSIALAHVAVSVAFGRWVFQHTLRRPARLFTYYFVGYVIFSILFWIPVVGWLFRFIAVSWGLGGILVTLSRHRESVHH